MPIFDSHSHYTNGRFAELGGARNALITARSAGVRGVMLASEDAANTRANLALASENSDLGIDFYIAAGTHPECVLRDGFDFSAELREIESLADDPRITAVGECGLDYYWDKEHRAGQRTLFTAQLETAARHRLPVIIHDREAHGDIIAILRERGKINEISPPILHSFSGSGQTAREAVALGAYLGFSGVVTFKNARVSKESLAAVPLNRLLIETDAPYLAPDPHRGKCNTSAHLPLVIAKIAEIKGVSAEEITDITYKNAKELFTRK